MEEQRFKLHAPYKPTGDQPQAIEKLVKGLKTDPEFNKLYQTEYGAASIVPASDPRPTISLTRDAATVFASVADMEE